MKTYSSESKLGYTKYINYANDNNIKQEKHKNPFRHSTNDTFSTTPSTLYCKMYAFVSSNSAEQIFCKNLHRANTYQ
ncbi:conserved Plasmodium protein, unknown function [Plasmodium knowlesi strain H]|uniref:Uncharacterized protein n=1 Tax=Plasmodium knowlesi (strain H) TaxID=5851 RepID=A0A1A7W2J1_PLAKH|nr:conserved Plasmodium protein, unknown function [Plasmodium knowlesi strain H]